MCIEQSAGHGRGLELNPRQPSAKNATPKTGIQLGTARRYAAACNTSDHGSVGTSKVHRTPFGPDRTEDRRTARAPMGKRKPRRSSAVRNADGVRRPFRQAEDEAERSCTSIVPTSCLHSFRSSRERLRTRAVSFCNPIEQAAVAAKSLTALFAADVREAFLAANYVARSTSLSRDVAGRCRSTARNGPSASWPRFAGDHQANLSVRDSCGTTPSSRRSGEASSWTQMDSS
jgi:hypothetical protein